MAPVPLPNCPVFMAAPILATKTLHGDIVVSLLLFFSCIIRVREPGNLSTNRKLLDLWICDSAEGFFHSVWELQKFKKVVLSAGKLLQLFHLCPDFSHFFNIANVVSQHSFLGSTCFFPSRVILKAAVYSKKWKPFSLCSWLITWLWYSH